MRALGRRIAAVTVSRRVYNSKRWQRLRLSFLADSPLCVLCRAAGFTVGAVDVDHVVPIADGGDPWDRRNLQGLCKACHSRKTRADMHRRKGPAACIHGYPPGACERCEA